MKYQVKARFIDKHSKELYPVDSLYETVDEERATELQGRGFLGDPIQEDTLLNKTVQEIIEALPGEYSKEELLSFLKEESNGKNRKTVKGRLEELLKEGD